MLRAYADCMSNLDFSGPTYLAPVIKAAAKKAASVGCQQDNQKYHILLILTDGCIDDKEQTITAIIEASYTPLSIIIIGE